MVEIRIPSFGIPTGPTPGFDAPEVGQFRDQTGAQLRDLGGALAAAGRGVSAVAAGMQDDIDEGLVRQLDSQMSDAVREELFNPDKGFLATVGEAAYTSSDAARQRIADLRRKLEERLENPDQRRLFARHADARVQDAFARIDRHAAVEAKAFNLGQAEARVDRLIEDAVTLGGPGFVRPDDESRIALVQAVTEVSRIRGESGELALARWREAAGRAHAGVVHSMLADPRTRAKDAAAYLDAAGKDGLGHVEVARMRESIRHVERNERAGELTSILRQGVDASIESLRSENAKANIARNAKDWADVLGVPVDVVMQAAETTGAPPPLSKDAPQVRVEPTRAQKEQAWASAFDKLQEARDGAEGTADADIYDSVGVRLDRDYRRWRRDEDVALSSALTSAERFLADKRATATVDDFARVDPEAYERIVENGRLPDIKSFARTGRYDTDPDLMWSLENMTPQQLRALGPEQIEVMRTRLAPDAYGRLRMLIGKAQGDPDLTFFLSADDLSRATAKRLGYVSSLTGRLTPGETEALAAFRLRVSADMVSWQQQTEKQATLKDYKDYLDSMERERVNEVVHGWFGGVSSRVTHEDALDAALPENTLDEPSAREAARGKQEFFVDLGPGKRPVLFYGNGRDSIPRDVLIAMRQAAGARVKFPTYADIAAMWDEFGRPLTVKK